MAKIEVRLDVLAKLKGKTVLITGGSNGIGRQTVLMLHGLGANVVVGDLDVARGESLVKEIGGNGIFQKTDITNWESLRDLFEAAKSNYGSIDVVMANAGAPERPPFLFDESFDGNGLLKEPDLSIIDVNLNGVMRTAKLALHYFARNPPPGGVLVITGSAASYFASPPIVRYCAAKHALLGLMRSTAAMTKLANVRVNLVAPWMTETEFSSEASDIWGSMPINTAREVAEALCVAAADDTLHGRALYVAKEIVDFELPLYKTQEDWMTLKQAAWFEQGRERLALGMKLPGAHYLKDAV
ncbi:uncharacterized protein A1O5_02207 [Cladophialophora psammophila CBS 110553]|uniref:Uncharacterized protein n=1 Tax=Cladophialophora psammophila CBS 110553 TaxID=1182543 RepID=W9X173_9EURO|nr:uncharacterized protein A1O5_02207 [Cladophialophora psammophila CBS 110553]EXJ73913.1 hypothetical protein A1O5_02207 [Cladophialophora psammophila CBS 110553]